MATNDQQAIHATRIEKLPPFAKEDPRAWFAQCEITFELLGVTGDLTKYRYIMVNLPPDVLCHVREFLEVQPPEGMRYLTVKNRIISRLTSSTEERIHRLLYQREILDEKPTQLLARLRSQAGSDIPEDIIRTAFINRMPENIKMHLVMAPATDLGGLADLADRAWSLRYLQLAPVEASSPDNGTTQSSVDSMPQASAELDAIQRQKNKSNSNSETCYFHRKFGRLARNCRKPCRFHKNRGNANGDR